jgi:pimeloyl-ACP methyl ester carboxylesterase
MTPNDSPASASNEHKVPQIHRKRIEADGVRVFYREAGDPNAPVVLLLHGFGFTEVPADRGYTYTFEALAKTIEAFTDALALEKYALYIFDYGAPTGLRLAMAHPERVTAIVSQNGNAYEEGLGDAWAPIRLYWNDPSAENRNAIRGALTAEGMKREYSVGMPNSEVVAPESYTLDGALLARPGNVDIQLDLFLDYANNVKLYPKFQEYFRTSKPPLLAIWGKNDLYFIPPGAGAFRRDIPNATVQFLDTGHFALETHLEEIAAAMRAFLAANIDRTQTAKA